MRHLVSLATLALLVITSGVTAGHSHTADVPDAARACTVCHIGETPLAPAPGPTTLPARTHSFIEVAPPRQAAVSADPTSLHRSRAPPSV